jgi:hypothetical protein
MLALLSSCIGLGVPEKQAKLSILAIPLQQASFNSSVTGQLHACFLKFHQNQWIGQYPLDNYL